MSVIINESNGTVTLSKEEYEKMLASIELLSGVHEIESGNAHSANSIEELRQQLMS